MLAAFATLFLLFVADATVRGLDTVREVRAASASAEAMRRGVAPLLAQNAAALPDRNGYDALVRDAGDARAHLARAQSRLGYLRWIAKAAAPVPTWGPQIAAAPDALDMGERVTTHTGELLAIAAPLFTGTGPLTDRVRDVVVVHATELDTALAGLEVESARADRLARVEWSGPAVKAGPIVRQLAGYLHQASDMRAMAAAASSSFDAFMGFDGRRTFIVLGQFTEQFNILQLAEFVTNAARHLGIEAKIAHLPNPRVESETHYYNAVHTRLTDLGLEPHLLSDTLVESLMRTAVEYREAIDVSQLPPRVDWRLASNPMGPRE